jgi:hypothetical protein
VRGAEPGRRVRRHDDGHRSDEAKSRREASTRTVSPRRSLPARRLRAVLSTAELCGAWRG